MAKQSLFQMAGVGFKAVMDALSPFRPGDVGCKVAMVGWWLFLKVAGVCKAVMDEWLQ
ncbi:MAG: hypothetical protein WAU54_11325 [Chania sp.]